MKLTKITIVILLLLLSKAYGLSNRKPNIKKNSSFSLKVFYPEAKSDDELALFIPKGNIVRNYVESGEFDTIIAKRSGIGWYKFNYNFPNTQKNKGIYIVIAKMQSQSEQKNLTTISSAAIPYYILDHYYVQKGDRIFVNVHKAKEFALGRSPIFNFRFQFSGKAALKYQVRYTIDSVGHSMDFESDYFDHDSTYNNLNFENRKIEKLLLLIDKHKKHMDADAYVQLKLHVIYQTKIQEALLLRHAIKNNWNNASIKSKNLFLKSYLESNPTIPTGFHPSDLFVNCNYWYAELGKADVIATTLYGAESRDSLIRVISKTKPQLVSENLIILALKEFSGHFKNPAANLLEAKNAIASPELLAQLKRMMKNRPGEVAYDFKLTDLNGNRVSLSDFKGKVVFIDFWYTGCGNCLNYFHDVLSGIEENFRQDTNIVFITVSIDKNKDFWVQSVNSGIYTSKTAINLYTNGEGYASDVIKFYDITAFPRPMVIDKKQRLVETGDALRTKTGLLEALESARHE